MQAAYSATSTRRAGHVPLQRNRLRNHYDRRSGGHPVLHRLLPEHRSATAPWLRLFDAWSGWMDGVCRDVRHREPPGSPSADRLGASHFLNGLRDWRHAGALHGQYQTVVQEPQAGQAGQEGRVRQSRGSPTDDGRGSVTSPALHSGATNQNFL